MLLLKLSAMKFRTLSILLTVFITMTFFSIRAQVVINEISYNPPESGNDSLEYIELYNAGAASVDMNGWHFQKGVLDTFKNVTLNAGAYFVTAINASVMAHIFGVTAHQWSGGALNNNGESIVLVDSGGNLIDSVAYKDVDPWPTAPDGNGPSLELIDSGSDNNDGVNWQSSGGNTGIIINGFEVSGTPGAANSGGGTGGPAVTIDLANFQFTPKNAVVKIGDLVRWVNSDGANHNVNGSQATHPGNPESFLSGPPATGAWQFDYTPSLAGLYNYQCDVHVSGGMVGTLGVYDPLSYTDFPLSVLRLTDGVNGSHIYDGVPTTVTGVVHGINFQPTGYSFYVIQPDNVGINVFSPTPGSYTVQEGDMVKVSGVIDQFNGLLEIVPDAIELLSSGNALVTAREVSTPSEEDEGSYVYSYTYSIDSIVATGTSGFNVYTTHESGSKLLIRVDADSEVDSAAIAHSNAVTGIGTQFDPSFPYTSGYQILALHVLIVDGVKIVPQDKIILQPNPAAESFLLQGDLLIEKIELFSFDGKLVRSEKVNSTQTSVQVENLSPGLYVVKAITPEGLWTSKVIVNR